MLEERNTQKKLLAAAAPLFAKNGFDAVRIKKIAEAAEVNDALISYYFGGKEGLYLAVLESQLYPLRQSLNAWWKNAAALSAREQLRRYVEIMITQQQQPFLSQLLFHELLHPTVCSQPLLQNYLDQSFRCIHRILEAGARAGDFKPNLPIGHVKIMWHSMLNFYIINALPASAEHHSVQCLDMLLNGIVQTGEKINRA